MGQRALGDGCQKHLVWVKYDHCPPMKVPFSMLRPVFDRKWLVKPWKFFRAFEGRGDMELQVGVGGLSKVAACDYVVKLTTGVANKIVVLKLGLALIASRHDTGDLTPLAHPGVRE